MRDPPRDLRYAQLNKLFAHGLWLARRDDEAGVGNGDADARDDLREHIVGHAVVEGIGVDIVRRAHARHADRVRTYAEHCFEMFGMHEQPSEFVGVALQAEENAQAHIVDARFHRAIVRFGVVGVIALRARGVEFFIALFVVGLLKQNIGADLGFLELAVVLDRGSCDVHVRATDCAVLVLDRVDGLKVSRARTRSDC